MGKNDQERRRRKEAEKAQQRAEGLVTASARNIRIAPLKVRRVVDLIRGKDYADAVNILNFTQAGGAEPVRKVVQSAAANAEHNYGMDSERLYVRTICVDEGFTFKRMHPTTMGRARIIKKRSSHITVQLAERPRVRTAKGS
jgi:large subunit ribosomal protein L22